MQQSIDIYGIKTCDTVRKSIKWLNQNQLESTFHDLKTINLSHKLVEEWFLQVGEKTLINRRGLTWRKLPDAQKALSNQEDLIQLVIENPTLVKRPVVHYLDMWSVGFDPQDWQSRFL